MGQTTYKNLFQLVQEQIKKTAQYQTTKTYRNQLDRAEVAPLYSNSVSDFRAAEIVTSIQNLLREALPGFIIEGLRIKASTPESAYITITAGKGSQGGVLFTLDADTVLEVPYTTDTSVFYISLFLDRIMIDKNIKDGALALGKIVVPHPEKLYYYGEFKVYDRRDDRDDENQAYIVSYIEQKFHGNEYGELEEDSVDILRSNIGKVLTKNLIGDIQLSENLKITNTQGTLELDSSSMKLSSSTGSLLAKFTKDGTFYYDSNGIEVARFATDSAKIGNMLLTKSTIQSGNFVSGALGAGFQIQDTGDAEFNSVKIRGKLTSSVFEKDTISAIGGNLLVMDADVLDADMTALDTSTLTIKGDTTFAVNDILRIKDGVDDEWLTVTGVSGSTYQVTRDNASSYAPNANPAWRKGTSVVNYGVSGEGGVYLTSSEANSPYVSIVTHAGSPWECLCTQTRLGNLNGYLGYTSDCYGIGIGSDTAYLKYDPTGGLQILGKATIQGNTAIGTPATPGLYLGSDKIGYYSGSEWKSYFDCDGKFCFKGDATNYVAYDGSTLCIRGRLNADDLYSGNICADRIGAGHIYTCLGITIATSPEASGGLNARTCFDAISIKSYNDLGNLRFQLCDGHLYAEDILLQDPNCCCCYSCLNGGALQFHDECGPVPYVKRICSGSSCTGCTIYLAGWKTAPEVIVGIKTLYSYNATSPSQTQQWDIYADCIQCYCNSGNIYGYSFQVHATLRVATGSGTECIKSANFDTCFCTEACTCATKIVNKFQLWCHGAAPANYYYGTICYALCYRVLGSGTWCACCFSHIQTHGSLAQVTTDDTVTDTMTFACMATWELMAHEVSVTWTDSGFASGSISCCLCTRAISATTAGVSGCLCYYPYLGCANDVCCLCCASNTAAVAGSTPSNVYCAYACLCYCTYTPHVYLCGRTCIYCYCAWFELLAFAMICSTYNDAANPYSCCISNRFGCTSNVCCEVGFCITTTYSTCMNLNTNKACAFPNFVVRSYICQCLYATLNQTEVYTKACSYICFLGGNLYQCYCVNVGDAATCCYKLVYSTCDCYGCYCVLDPNGCLNWLAIAYT